ncbi:MAG: TerB family tellurite resistance protein [Yoonia sp.]|uniref:TerB family tellurite resistance protein n=1 Tax=Yoonia sp. TaxID=2212373 RepID=UPI002740244E|nr:TerB family tellurite resistance protein [Yoonia sp.]MDP5084984.1 TerB family tellurite resistance protein [Yoonia sp.]
MKRFMITLLLSLLLGNAAQAFIPSTGTFTELEPVAETQIPGASGEVMSLCHVTSTVRILGLPLFSDITGYALSSDGCQLSLDRPFTKEQMETAQSLNLVDPNLPSTARNDFERNVKNYGIWVVLVLGLLVVIIRRLRSILGLNPRAPMRKKASQRILTAMCYVGKCDGMVAANEIALISRAARRLTRRNVEAAEVIRITDHIDMNLTKQDYIDFGRGLRDSEKDVMMRGAFYVALSSGRLLPSEHEFLSELAHGIGMPGEDFRRVMNLALADLDAFPPA